MKQRILGLLGVRTTIDNQVNPQLYSALAAHAAKVLNSGENKPDPSYSDRKKNVAFSYKVQDDVTGDDFSHTQSQDARATNGEYRVKLPDGRVQIVSYTADKNGYKADVKYTEDENSVLKSHPEPIQVQQIRPIQLVKHPIKGAQIPKSNDYDYLYSDEDARTEVPYSSVLPEYDELERIQTNVEVADYYTKSPDIGSSPLQLTYQNKYKVIPDGRVQLFENIHGGQKVPQINGHNLYHSEVGKFIVSTLAPYTLDSSKGFQQNAASSTLGPGTERYSQIYINTPRFNLVQRHHNELYYEK